MKAIALAMLVAAGCGGASADPDAYTMAPGARLTVERFDAADGTRVEFTVTGALGQPVAVGVAYEGVVAPGDAHKSYAWIGAKDADPYVDATPAPLLAGPYRIELGCGEEAVSPCAFSFTAEIR